MSREDTRAPRRPLTEEHKRVMHAALKEWNDRIEILENHKPTWGRRISRTKNRG